MFFSPAFVFVLGALGALGPSAVRGANSVTLFNTRLPVDAANNTLITGEADVLEHDGALYLYFNNWGGCPGVDCCASSGGCASCCFAGPDDPCVYTQNHTVVAYRTTDLRTFEPLGVVLSVAQRHRGIEFRPHVVFNPATRMFVMWYEDRWSGQAGYAVAVASSPAGPFKTVADTVKMATSDKIGDFDVLVDDDGTAYHVRTGFVVEQLNRNMTGPSGKFARFSTPRPAEGPVFFKRNGVFYIMPGTSCCACRGGSSAYVFTSSSPLGPYTYRGDVGSNTTAPFSPSSPYNFPSRAQASAVFKVGSTYVWMGNQWVTAAAPGHPRNHDLLYWWPLHFTDDGNVTQFERADNVTVTW